MADEPVDPAPPAPASRAIAVAVGAMILIAIGAIAWAVLPRPAARTIAVVSPSPVAAALATPVAAVSPASPPDSLAAAFKAVTGKTDRVLVDNGQGETTTVPLKLLQLPFGPVLLTSTEIKDGCHACTGSIGVYYLAAQGASFTVKKKWPEAVSGWGWGAAPDWSVSEKFTDYPAIYASGGYMNQGYSCDSATLTELRPDGPVQSDLITLSTSNEGAVESGAETLTGKIAHIVKDTSFEVQATGAEKVTEHYVRRGDKFVRVERESKLGC